MKKKFLVAALILVVSTVAFFVIGLDGQVKRISKSLENVTVKLKWTHQAQFAGNYLAAEKGFYAEEGIVADFVPYSEENKTIDAVISGKATFGITGADELLLAREKGMPLKAVAVIYKINPVCAYSLKQSGIIEPSDFIGKTVGLEKGINVEYLYSAMMNKLKIDRSAIKEVAIGFTASELLEGKTDVSTGYVINEPQQVIEFGQDVNIIMMSDYGVNMYADVLFATENTITNNPNLVEGFARATLKGWEYAIKNMEEATDVTLKYATASTKQHELNMLKASVSLINDGESPIGWMERNKWNQVSNILLEQKILPRAINVSDAYTMEFLNKIYNLE